MRTILLTGATGFLGSNLLRKLTEEGHSVIVLKRSFSDLSRIREFDGRFKAYNSDEADLSRIFEENKIDAILHCATDYGRKNTEPMRLIEANLILPLTLLQLAAKHGVHAFISTDTILDKRVGHYSLSKKQFLDWLKVYSDRLVCVNVALEHFFGPADDPSKFVSSIIQQLIQEVPSIDLTLGEQLRDFIHIDDVVDAFSRILERSAHLNFGFKHFEVGSGHPMAIRAFVETIQKAVGNTKTKLKFGALPYRENEVMESRVDLKPLGELGWQPRVSLEEGLRRTIDSERKRLKR